MPSLVESSSESDSDSDEADYKEIDTHESWRSQPASVSQGRLPLRQVQIFLSGVHGRTITLEVALDDTVDAVLSKIEDKEGVPCNGPHRIVFSCRTLQRHRTLTDYGVCPDATLQMLALPRGGSGKHTSETATGAAGSGLESASASTFGASAAPAATIGGASTGGFGASTGGFGASAGGFGPPSSAAPGSGFAFGATPSAPTNSSFAFGATAAQATQPAGSFGASSGGMGASTGSFGASSGGMFDAVVATVTQAAPSCPQWAGQIFIQRAGRRTFVLNVTSDDTVASVKARLKWRDSRLIKSPLELCDDTRSLGSYGVRKEDTLLLCGRLCGGGVCMGKPTVVAPGEHIAPQDAAPAPQAPAAPTAPEEVAAPAELYQAERQKAMMPLSQAPVEKSPDQRPGSAALPMLVAKIKQMGFTDAQVSSAYLALGSEANEQQIVAYLVDGEEGRVSAAPAQRSATAKPVQDTVGEKAVIRLMEMGFSAAQIESAQQACLAESGGRFVEPKELMEWLLNKVQEQAKMDDEASMAAIRKLQQQDAQAQAIRDQACLDADARLGYLNNAKLAITSPGNKGWICKHGCGTVCEEGSEDENRCSYKLSGARRQSGTGTPIAFAAVSFAPY